MNVRVGQTAALRWARWTTRRRRAILAAAALTAAAAIPVAARLPLEGDLSVLLPPDTRSVRDLHALEGRAQMFGTIIVAVESDDAAKRAAVADLLRARLGALPPEAVIGVDADNGARDRFAWEHRYLLAPTADLEVIRDDLRARKARLNPLYVSLDDEGERAAAAAPIGPRLRALQEKLEAARAGAAHPAPRLSKDGRLQILVVRTRFAAGEVSRNAGTLAAVVRAVEEGRRAGGGAVRVGIAGDVVNTAAEHQALLGSMLHATVFTVVIVAAGMLLFFGAPAAVAALLAALALGAIATFAFARLAIGHLNLATAFLAPIVVGNGINFGIILLARYFEERRRAGGSDPIASLAAALQGSFGGTLAAALTASVSYAALLATDFRGFRHFGVIGGVGILFCWAATFLVLPAALATLEARGLAGGQSPARLGRGLVRLVPRRRPAVVLAALAALGGSAVGAWRYVGSHPFEDDFKNLRSSGPDSVETRRWNEKIDAAFGRGLSGATVIALPTRERARVVAERLRAADRDKPAEERLFATVSTLDDLVPPDQDDKRALLADIRRLLTDATLATLDPADRDAARALKPPADADIAPIADGDVPAALAWPYTERDGARGRLIVAMRGPGFDLWRTEDLDRFVGSFRGLGLGPDVVVGGNAFVQHDIVGSVYRDGPRATVVAAAGAVLIVLLVLGVTRQAVVTLLCGASGVLLLLTAANALGIRINFLDFVALPITIGIGIDYSVNIASRHRAEGRGSSGAILTATGPAVALCSYTTVVGYASLLFSANQGIRSFGFAALIGEVTCVGAAVLLAPALLDFGLRRRSRSRRPEAITLS
jgi:predicted RND superfamily exporter protein